MPWCLLIWLTFIPLGDLLAQKDGKNSSRLLDSAFRFEDFEQTISLTDQAEKIILSEGVEKNADLLIRCSNARIIACQYFERMKLLRQYIEKNDLLIDQLRLPLGSSYRTHKIYSKLAWAGYYYLINDQEKSLSLFSESLKKMKVLPPSTELCGRISAASQYVAAIHFANGEFEAAINQYISSIPYNECLMTNNKSNFSPYPLLFRNIGQSYLGKGDYNMARKYLKRAEDSVNIFLKKNPNREATTAITIYETQAAYYRAIYENDSALITFQKAIPLLQYARPFRSRVYQHLGDAYASLGKFSQAKQYLTLAVAMILKTSENAKDVQLAGVYLSLAKLYERQGSMQEALAWSQKAINSLILEFEPSGIENPTLRNVLSKKWLFTALQQKSQILLKLQPKPDTEQMVEAWQTCQLSLALFDSTVNEYSLDRDKVILAEQSFKAFEFGVELTYNLLKQTGDEHYFRECFSMADRSKGNVLLENLRMVNRFSGVSPEWFEKEKQVKSELVFTEQSIYKSEMKGKPSDEVPLLRERYANLKRDYADLMNEIKRQAPDYYRLRFDHQVLSPQKIQSELLEPGEALVEFFLGDSSLTVFGFSEKRHFVDHKPVNTQFFNRINRFKTLMISDMDTSKSEQSQLSEYFHEFLLKDCLTALGQQIRSLTIVPDGILGYIPFEVLKTKEPNGPMYLSETFTMRYGYSASYLFEQIKKKSKKANSFFAGFLSADGGQTSTNTLERKSMRIALPGAKKEMSSIATVLGSGVSLFDPATKDDFIRNAKDYRVLHLAMHSVVNDQNPMLSTMNFFADMKDSTDKGQLIAIELYNLELNADMAVLSACNTGFGTLRRGEGIMSFARGFAYAGVPSAVISLWPSPDKATSKIMVNFYKYLKSGESKDRALQQAKLDFIRDYPQMSAPFYWAGFVLTGNKEPLKFPSSRLWYWIFAALSLAEFFLIVANRKMALQSKKAA